MLNITQNKVSKHFNINDYSSSQKVFQKKHFRVFNSWLLVFLLIVVISLFLPWTQNIRGKGYVTTLQPHQRPQTIQSAIPGKIDKWYVQEGDFVQKGDTLLKVSEVKSEYFDRELVHRTEEQIEAKNQTSNAYAGKSSALGSQISALRQEQKLKLQQAQNKIQQTELKRASALQKLEAVRTQSQIAKTQFERVLNLQQEGLKSQREVEDKRLKWQKAEAQLTAEQNKLQEWNNELNSAQLELSRIQAEYGDKIAKAQGEIYSAQSSQFSTDAEISKLKNQRENYKQRADLQYVTAPQSGYINKALKAGIGETFKEGESLLSIMPADYELAVETYVNPIDLPLLHKGEKVRVQFDGWPAIVFSGWENISYGTYGAQIVAVENFISDDGKYRVLLAPDKEDYPWPKGIRVGSGAKTIALLEEVPIWFELWRNLNGFPPNFYEGKKGKTDNKKHP